MTQEGIVAIAITCCAECGMSYDIEEWQALELDGEKRTKDPAMHFELRCCAVCRHVISTRVDGLDGLDLFMSADAYAEAFGASRQHRVMYPEPTWRELYSPTLNAIAMALVALLVLALLVIGMVKVLL